MSRVCLAVVLASACADAGAAVERRCIVGLEARAPDAARKPTPAPKGPCPVAVADLRRNRGAVGDAASPARGPVRV